jgi:hypothetical protein
MGCSSMGHLASRSLFNVFFLLLGLLLLYWAICRELPELDADSVLILLDVRLAQLLDAGHTCQTAVQELEVPLVRELCTGPWIDAAFVVAASYVIFHCHRRWARYAMAAMAVVFFFDGPSRLFDATFPAPRISHIDPTYAMVDEEITVRFSLKSWCRCDVNTNVYTCPTPAQIALDGLNLKPGGHIAWVSYWGCATTSDVGACERQFSSEFSMGVAHVTFRTIDHFIPCYRDPPNPLKAQEYVCFPDVRIRVKDKQSIPGWSKIQQPTPTPAVSIGPTAAPDQVSAASVETSEQLAPVADDADEGVEFVAEVDSTSLEGDGTAEVAERIIDIAIDGDMKDSESTNEVELLAVDTIVDEPHSTEDTNDPADAAGTSERPNHSLLMIDEQSRANDDQDELKTFSADQDEPQVLGEEQHTPSNETLESESYTETTGDQAMKPETMDAQDALDVAHEVDTNGIVEVDDHMEVAEFLQTTSEEGVAVVAQSNLIEVEILAEDPSSLTAVFEEGPSSSSPQHHELDQVTTVEQTAVEDVTIPAAEQEAPIKQDKESESRETGVAAEAVHETLRANDDQEDAVKSALNSASSAAGEDTHDEDVGATIAEDVNTAITMVEPTSSKMIVLDKGEAVVTVEQKLSEEPITGQDTRIHPHEGSPSNKEDLGNAKDRQTHKPSEIDRPAQSSQRDRRRDQEREHSSISSIRADRRGSQSVSRSTSRQAPTTAR